MNSPTSNRFQALQENDEEAADTVPDSWEDIMSVSSSSAATSLATGSSKPIQLTVWKVIQGQTPSSMEESFFPLVPGT